MPQRVNAGIPPGWSRYRACLRVLSQAGIDSDFPGLNKEQI